MRTVIVGSALFGCLAGLGEAARLALLGHRPDQLIPLAGYGVLVDSSLFALLGGLAAVAWRLVCRIRGVPRQAGWLRAVPTLVGLLTASGLVLLSSGRATPSPSAWSAARVNEAVAVALGVVGLGALGWLSVRWARQGPLAGRPVLEVALAACVGLAVLAVGQDLYVHGLGASHAPPSRPDEPAASVPRVQAARPAAVDAPKQASGSPEARGEPMDLLPAESGTLPRSAVGAREAPIGPDRPNVLLITVDTLRADRLGVYGNDTAPTPVLDRLAREGVRFELAIVPQPTTNATHATLFTGPYPSGHGVRAHMLDTLRAGVPTLGERLRSAGYVTAGLYSWISLEPAYSGFERGFDTYENYTVNTPTYLASRPLQALALGYKKATERLALPGLFDQQLGAAKRVEDVLDGKADVTTDAAMRWLYERGTEPFFLWVHYFDPHYPYSPPEPYAAAFDHPCDGCVDGGMHTVDQALQGRAFTPHEVRRLFGLYDGEVAFTDAQIGRLLRTVGELGLAERTLVVVAGDHGESFNEHGLWVHGLSLYQHDVHVPLILRYPRVLPSSRVVRGPVSLVDVMPTILDLVGLPVPPAVEGRSLLPLVRGEEAESSRAAVTSVDEADSQLALLRRTWKLILDTRTGWTELYDLADDPSEVFNRAEQEPEVVARLLEEIRRWRSAH
jgi:arylsulfatase A-like enzyme